MGAVEEGGKTVREAIDTLRSAPLLMLVLLLNTIFIGLAAYGLHEISASVRARDTSQINLITNLIKDCMRNGL